jgi:hypothetical protein
MSKDKKPKSTLKAASIAEDLIKPALGNPSLLRMMDRIIKISLEDKPIKKKAKGGIIKKRYGGSVKKKTKKKK